MIPFLDGIAGIAFRFAVVAGAVVYGTNVGRAVGRDSIWHGSPWAEGAQRTAREAFDLGVAAAQRTLESLSL